MRATLLRLAVSSALLLAPAAAQADKPIQIGPISDQGVVTAFECPGFQVLNDYATTFVARQVLDRNGNVIRLQGQTWGVDTFINANTGKALGSPYHNNSMIDFRTGLAAVNGVIAKVVVPGVGPVFKDVGRIIMDRDGNLTFRAGTHQYLDGDVEALCAALQ